MTDLVYYAGLERLTTFPFPVYTSAALSHASNQIAARFERSYRILSTALDVQPQVGLVALAAEDWPRYAGLPTFGVTHYDYPHRMVVAAAEPSTFLQPVVELIGDASETLLQELRAVYGLNDGSIDLTPHVDLWVAHDLGHAFHLHAAYWFPRRWLMEYFADLCSYAYVAAEEPEQLPALETFPRVIGAVGAQHFRYHTLADFETQYGGDWDTGNYLWYHGALFAAARQSYQAAGVQSLRRMWQAFVLAGIKEATDAELIELLEQAQPELARVITNWLE
jgi:hypothetical protein